MAESRFYTKFFIIGTVCLANGLLINYALPPLISLYIDTQIALVPSSQSYPMWKDIPVPVYQKFYFFNVTNAQEIESRGHKPILEEVGPFTYRTDWIKRDIVNSDNDGSSDDETTTNNNTINFKQFKQWQFVPEMSIADHRLQLVTLNAPLAITLTLIQSASNAVRLLVTFSLDGLSEGFFTKRSVKQLLFDGYPDLLTTFGPLLNAEMLSQGGHFGYMNARNMSEDGSYEINTGLDDIQKLNTINKFNGKSILPYWNNNNQQHSRNSGHSSSSSNNRQQQQQQQQKNHCNSLDGATTGEMFPPFKDSSLNDTNLSIKLFQPDFCRVWRLDYNNDFHDDSTGLNLKRFYATRDVFKNSTELPENACFYKHPALFASSRARQNENNFDNNPVNTNRIPIHLNNNSNNQRVRNGRQQQATNGRPHSSGAASSSNRVRQEWPNGVFTLAPCKFNAPIYMSMPHFLDADPYFISQVDGLQPQPDKHEFFVDLEPKTGSPVVLAARVQLNVAISRPPGLVRFRNIPEIMFPVFWQELLVNVTSSKPVIDQLYLASIGAFEVTQRIAFSFLLLGVTILITVCIFYLHDLHTNKPSSDKNNISTVPDK